MVSIVTKASKGGLLTAAEMDANLDNLNSGLSGKQDTLVSGTNIKTINGLSPLGSGDISVATLTSNVFTGNQVFNDNTISRAIIKDCGYTFLDKGDSGTTTQILDYTAGQCQKLTVTGAHTISTSNWPPSGTLGEMLLELVNGASATVTFALAGTTMNWVKSDGSYSTTFAGSGVTLQAAGTDWLYMWSRDGGVTVQIKVLR